MNRRRRALCSCRPGRSLLDRHTAVALPRSDQTAAWTALAKSTRLARRHRSRAARGVPASSHRVAGTTAMLAEPTPSTRTAEAVATPTKPGSSSHRGPKPALRAEPCRQSPRLGSPQAAHLLDGPRDRSLACSTRAVPPPGRLLSQPTEEAVRPALSHTRPRVISTGLCRRLPGTEGRRPRTASLIERAVRRPRPRPPPSRPERVRSALRREPASPRPRSARPKPRGAERRNARLVVAARAEPPKKPDSRPPPDRSRTARPVSARPHCKQRDPASTGQTSRGEHTCARPHVRARSVKVAPALAARTRRVQVGSHQ